MRTALPGATRNSGSPPFRQARLDTRRSEGSHSAERVTGTERDRLRERGSVGGREGGLEGAIVFTRGRAVCCLSAPSDGKTKTVVNRNTSRLGLKVLLI
ncbi:hypothetical protein E2C01_044240 [Portunus trituberculatus]|uniref:Uncharacterized protein n=1 Tax=Portunus trituberculatus TaxID=210409 RepID=A0A5B7FV37_PORTR|nr:hypothetical protein [Portunus trituberculatus]